MKSLFKSSALLLLVLWLVACQEKEDNLSSVVVITSEVTDITQNTAKCGGTVKSDGGPAITAYGVCWSEREKPTYADNHTEDGKGSGSFVSIITGLEPGHTYHVRAYAVNTNGIYYGEDLSFSTGVSLPTVTTSSVSDVTEDSATCGGTVTNDGGEPVSTVGLCWGKTENPDLSGSHTEGNPGQDGSFVATITGLEAGNTYYIRAYATNSAGTAYGNQVSFSLSSEACVEPTADSKIWNYIVGEYDSNNDGKIQLSEAEAVTIVDVQNKGVTTIEGLDQFTNLVALLLNGNSVKQIDLRPFTKLQQFWGYDNPVLESLQVSGLDKLQQCHCYNTPLASLDLTGCSSMQEMNLYFTKLEALDVSGCPDLTLLNVDSAPIKKVDVSNHTKLTFLNVANCTKLEELKVQGCNALIWLYANNCSCKYYDVSGLQSLMLFYQYAAPVQDVTLLADNCPALEFLHFYDGKVTTFSMKNCPNVREVRAWMNYGLKSADVTGSFKNNPGELNLDGSPLEEIHIDKDNSIWYLNLNYNRLGSLDLTGGFTALTEFYTSFSNLSSIKVTGLPLLKIFHSFDHADQNDMLYVEADNCPELVECFIYNARARKISVKNCTKLWLYRCFSNSLEGIDMTGCPTLKEINVDGSPLEYMNITPSGNPNIEYVNIHGNKLTSLDFSGYNAMFYLHCGNAFQLTSIKYAPNLQEIYHFNLTNLETIDVSGLSSLRILWCYGDNNDNLRAGLRNLVISGNTSLVDVLAFRTHMVTADIRGAADAMNNVWFDANLDLVSLTVRATQTFVDMHRDNQCELVVI